MRFMVSDQTFKIRTNPSVLSGKVSKIGKSFAEIVHVLNYNKSRRHFCSFIHCLWTVTRTHNTSLSHLFYRFLCGASGKHTPIARWNGCAEAFLLAFFTLLFDDNYIKTAGNKQKENPVACTGERHEKRKYKRRKDGHRHGVEFGASVHGMQTNFYHDQAYAVREIGDYGGPIKGP